MRRPRTGAIGWADLPAAGCLLAAALWPAGAGAAATTPAGHRVPPVAAAAPSGDQETADLASLRSDAIAAYRREDYARAAQIAATYVDRARAGERTGREFAAVSFILGHSRYELHHRADGPYAGDYRAEIVQPLEDSLRVLQDDPAFKNMLLGNAYYELWTMTGRRDPDVEGRADWHLLKSILIREAEARDRPRSGAEYDLFARHLLLYLERCLDLASDSSSAAVYLERIRAVAPSGFGTAYDARFWQIYNLTYFDGGNMKAAALWQRALDGMQNPQTPMDRVLAMFRQAAELTHHARDQAEIYRQMADYVSTEDEPERRLQAADFARKAYGLDPGNAEIRRQFGSALHLLSYGAYASRRFSEALHYAEEATSFQWDGMEVAFFDLSRSAAELGQESNALTHGERAYRMAKQHAKGAALQPFAQNYVNILRQFGQDALAERIRHEEADLGVR
jgi:hypothetical protein